MNRWVLWFAVACLLLSGCAEETIPTQTLPSPPVLTSPEPEKAPCFPQSAQGLIARELKADEQGIAVLTVYNPGPRGLRFAVMEVDVAGKKLYFQASWLPAGESTQVTEFLGAAFAQGEAVFSCLKTTWDWFSLGEGKITLTLGEEGLTVENVTGQWLPGMMLYCRSADHPGTQMVYVSALQAGQHRTVPLEKGYTVVTVEFDGA